PCQRRAENADLLALNVPRQDIKISQQRPHLASTHPRTSATLREAKFGTAAAKLGPIHRSELRSIWRCTSAGTPAGRVGTNESAATEASKDIRFGCSITTAGLAATSN